MDRNIVQELCEALSDARNVLSSAPISEMPYEKGEDYNDRWLRISALFTKIDAALAKAGFNEGGGG